MKKTVRKNLEIEDRLDNIINDYEQRLKSEEEVRGGDLFDVYNIGGGLSNEKFVSKRYEFADKDALKLTLGQATALFKRATKLSTKEIKDFILDIYDYKEIEWHHAGYYNGKMRKVYFLNAKQIINIAKKLKDKIKN